MINIENIIDIEKFENTNFYYVFENENEKILAKTEEFCGVLSKEILEDNNIIIHIKSYNGAVSVLENGTINKVSLRYNENGKEKILFTNEIEDKIINERMYNISISNTSLKIKGE